MGLIPGSFGTYFKIQVMVLLSQDGFTNKDIYILVPAGVSCLVWTLYWSWTWPLPIQPPYGVTGFTHLLAETLS